MAYWLVLKMAAGDKSGFVAEEQLTVFFEPAQQKMTMRVRKM